MSAFRVPVPSIDYSAPRAAALVRAAAAVVMTTMSALVFSACGGDDQPTAPSTALDTPTVPTTGPATFDIQLRFVGDGATPRLREAFTRATARWRQVIVGDMGSTSINAAAGECQGWMPALRETVNDLVVYVRATKIDGPNNIVAQASPCYVSSETRLPILGYFELDSDDVELLVNRAVLDDVVLHELGHVLGIGTMWNYRRALLTGTGTNDPFFNGSGARAAFLTSGGAQHDGTPVPVENTGNQGMRDAHWRTSVFGNELMQGVVQPGGMPLSSVTIASLGDLGYTVSLSAADRFSLNSALRTRTNVTSSAEDLPLGRDVVQGPLFEVDRGGAKRRIAPH